MKRCGIRLQHTGHPHLPQRGIQVNLGVTGAVTSVALATELERDCPWR